MQAIATLVHDDPYMKLSPEQRAAAVRDRRARFFKPAEVINCVFVRSEVTLPAIQNSEIKNACEIVAKISRGWCQVESIQRMVAAAYPPVTLGDIKSARRTAIVVRPRQIAMYLAKIMTLRSLPDIGRRFGGRDHTTVLHAVNKITAMVGADEVFAAHVESLRASIAEVLA